MSGGTAAGSEGALPSCVVWDITYACPLRCTHCYSESGRRPSRQLPLPELLRVADALASMKLSGISISGGEPFLVAGLPRVLERFAQAGLHASVYTSGWGLDAQKLAAVRPYAPKVHVSIDGATAATHDRIRGRIGSFDRVLDALALLDACADAEVGRDEPQLRFGTDTVVLQSNLAGIESLCSGVLRRYRHLSFAIFNAGIPSGLAAEEAFAEAELLAEPQLADFRNGALRARLQALAPPGCAVAVTDGFELQMHPDRAETYAAEGGAFQVEPDGAVRAMNIYEGTVGNLLTDPPADVWRRALERRRDPVVVGALGPARTLREWAAATRQIDRHSASPADLVRIGKRTPYAPGGST